MKNINDQIRKETSGDINDLNVDFLYPEDDQEGTRITVYTGKVIDNKDPGRLGRCKIRVFGVFSDAIKDDDLPWALPDFGFVGSLKGSFIVPPKDAIVSVYFENGDRYLPRYVNKVIDENNMPSDKNEDYPNTMVFYETDRGDKFIINRRTGKTTFEHSSKKFKIQINPNGTMFLEGSNVIPEGTGPLCAIPFCLFTGAPHTGRTSLPGTGTPPIGMV